MRLTGDTNRRPVSVLVLFLLELKALTHSSFSTTLEQDHNLPVSVILVSSEEAITDTCSVLMHLPWSTLHM